MTRTDPDETEIIDVAITNIQMCTQNESTSTNSTNTTENYVAAFVVGGLLLVAITAILAFFVWKKRSDERGETPDESDNNPTNGTYGRGFDGEG